MKYLLIALLALLVACAPAQKTMGETAEQKAMEKEAMEKGEWTTEQIAQMEKDEMMEKPAMEEKKMMEPGLIGGDISKYYDWDKAKFDQAVAEGKTRSEERRGGE